MPRTADEADADDGADAVAIGLADATEPLLVGLADAPGPVLGERSMGTLAMAKPLIAEGILAMAAFPELLAAVCRPVAMAGLVAVAGGSKARAATPSANAAAYFCLALGDFDASVTCLPRAMLPKCNRPASP